MTVLITLTIAGADTGPFDLYSDVDGFTTPFETDVDKTSLTSGYSSVLVPDYTTVIKVQSKGNCIDYLNINVQESTTTTTSTSSTTTTSTSLTTTTTTTLAYTTYCYTGVYTEPDPVHPNGGSVNYIDNFGNEYTIQYIWTDDYVQIQASSIIKVTGAGVIPCTTTTTTTV